MFLALTAAAMVVFFCGLPRTPCISFQRVLMLAVAPENEDGQKAPPCCSGLRPALFALYAAKSIELR